MLRANHNIFGPPALSRTFQDVQHSSKVDSICTEIKEHLCSIGSSQSHDLSQILTNEYIGLKSSASQNMMDVYHQSGAQSFEEFVNDTSLSCLRQENSQIFDQYKQFQSIYNNDICQPLSHYKPSDHHKFTNDLAETLEQLSLAFYDCKNRKIHQKCCTQMDVMFPVQSTARSQSSDEEDSNDEDEDEDEEYDSGLRLYDQHIRQSLNFLNLSSKNYHNKFDETFINNKTMDTSMSKYSDVVENELDKGLAHIMRVQFRGSSNEPFTYQRNEILVDNYNQYTVKTLTTRDTVPKLSFENAPLFRHYNTINGIKSMVKYLNHQTANLLVFSFHILPDCMQLFCYIYDNGKIYGSRIFTKDLFQTVPRFYKCSTIDDVDKEEILKNMKITNDLQFDDDNIYKEYHVVLTSRKATKNNKIEIKFGHELEKLLETWVINNHFNNPLDLQKLIEIFVSHQIDYKWFKNNCRQTEFFSILIKNKYSIPIINALWDHLTGIKYKIKKKKHANPLQLHHARIRQKHGIKQFQKRINYGPSISSNGSPHGSQKTQNNEIPSTITQDTSDTSHNYQSSNVDNQLNKPEIQRKYKGLPIKERKKVNCNVDDLTMSPMNIQEILSFNDWHSGFNGCRQSDQSSDEDGPDIKCTETDHSLPSSLDAAIRMISNSPADDNDAVYDTISSEIKHIISNIDGIWNQMIPNLQDGQQINNNIITCNPTGSDKQKQTASSNTNNGNSGNDGNNNNRNHNNGNHGNNGNYHNHNNNYNNNNGNNNNGGPSGYINSSILSPYQIGNCPFCAASNISFRLYLIHCSLDHPSANYNMHAAVQFWEQHNKALLVKQALQSTAVSPISPQTSVTPSSVTSPSVASPSVPPPSPATPLSLATPSSSATPSSLTTPSSPVSTSSTPFSAVQSLLTYNNKKTTNGTCCFEPSNSIRARKNIYMSRQFTQDIKSNIIQIHKNIKCYFSHNNQECICDGLYLWMDIDIAMQFNNKKNKINDKIKVFNCDLADQETKEDLYVVIEKEDEENKYPWRVRNELHTNSMLYQEFGIKHKQLPQSVRMDKTYKLQMDHHQTIKSFLRNKRKSQKLINDTKWCDIKVFSKNNTKRRRQLSITNREFTNDLKKIGITNENLMLVPILMFNKYGYEYEVHHLWIVQIDGSMDIGIALSYDEKFEKVKIMGIHIDKQSICKQHQWINLDHLDNCHCLDNFKESSFNHLQIGKIDAEQNKMNDLLKKLNDMRMKNNRDTTTCPSSPSTYSGYDIGKKMFSGNNSISD